MTDNNPLSLNGYKQKIPKEIFSRDSYSISKTSITYGVVYKDNTVDELANALGRANVSGPKNRAGAGGPQNKNGNTPMGGGKRTRRRRRRN
jgi:hypothetical protein